MKNESSFNNNALAVSEAETLEGQDTEITPLHKEIQEPFQLSLNTKRKNFRQKEFLVDVIFSKGE